MKRIMLILSVLALAASGAYAQELDPNLPADFPPVTTHVYDSNAIGKGYIYMAVAAEVEGTGYYLMILENDGTPVWFKELTDDYSYDFKLQCNGLPTYAQFLHHHSYTGGGDVVHMVMDPDFGEIESIQMGNGYTAEAHDFQMLPNGHVLLFGYYLTQMDLSALVEGGYPNALVSGGVVQELDADRDVVFQWRTWDHYSLEEMSWRRADRPIVSQFHLNTINMDVDGNILLATPVWVKKIDRQTGEIIWHLGGDENEFAFVGVDHEEASGHFGGHAFYRLGNGNVLIYDGGNRDGTRSSKVHEYKLDEESKTAEFVWTYTPDPPVYGWHRGNAQRLPNGNTFIGWGGDGSDHGPACTEVTPEGEKVFELFFDHPSVESYRAFRLPLPTDTPRVYVTMSFVGLGDHYFRHGQTDTGVVIRINNFKGTGYSALGVERVSLAPVYPEFEGRAPRVLPVRVRVGASGISSIDARLSLNVDIFGLTNPEEATIYRRNIYGETGPFKALPTTYNPATKMLRADMDAFGEFIIGTPDLEHVALAPILIAPESEGTVNQELPVALDWTPRGFVDGYHLQVSTDPGFGTLVVDESELKETPYILETVEAGTVYYWRVSTINEAGPSEWSVDVFETVLAAVEVTVPNGAEEWQRGIEYFIQWEDNLAEDVVIELHRGGALLQTIDTVPSTGAYKWEADLTLEAGTDYSIRVRSSVDETMADVSDAVFTIQ
ncbi:MAG: aryl-sulfate sulfotransferase [Phycisphaerales bacterium]|nr:MAG: aryl-sulfate sulfotransferase [Phycisphaerales bacterium]